MIDGCGDRPSGGDGANEDDLSLMDFRRTHFLRVLEACGNDIHEAARVLGVTVAEIRRELHGSGGAST